MSYRHNKSIPQMCWNENNDENAVVFSSNVCVYILRGEQRIRIVGKPPTPPPNQVCGLLVSTHVLKTHQPYFCAIVLRGFPHLPIQSITWHSCKSLAILGPCHCPLQASLKRAKHLHSLPVTLTIAKALPGKAYYTVIMNSRASHGPRQHQVAKQRHTEGKCISIKKSWCILRACRWFGNKSVLPQIFSRGARTRSTEKSSVSMHRARLNTESLL